MNRSRFRVSPLTPRFGAEIEGIDVTTLEPDDFVELRQLWLTYKVIFLRDQSLDLDQLEAFSRHFGDLMRLPYIEPVVDHPQVIRVLKEADEVGMGVFGGDWHSDFSFLPAPPAASILYAEQVPACGGDTLWIDMGAACASLPQADLDLLQGRTAIHAGKPYGVTHAPEESTQFKGSITIDRNNPEADEEIPHPAICRHPETGESVLFVNPTYTTRIDGLSATDSNALLARLYTHATRPEFGCRFRWRNGSLALWDNRSTLHYAVNDYDGERRCLYRTTIAGSPPAPAH